MELRHLRYFVAVAGHLSFRRAAESLHLSQPPLSAQIADLEYELGTPLFIRAKKRITLSPAGEMFLPRAKDILARAQDAKDAAKLAAEGKLGILTIRFISSAVTGVLQECIGAFKKRHPLVELNLEQSHGEAILAGVAAGDIDIGFVRLPFVTPQGAQAIPVTREDYMVALPAGHRLAAKKKITLKDLDDDRLIIYPRDTAMGSYDDILSLYAAQGLTPAIVQTAIEQSTIAGFVAAGMGYSIVPACMQTIRVPGVIHRPLVGGKGRTGIALVTAKDGSDLVKGFLEAGLAGRR